MPSCVVRVTVQSSNKPLAMTDIGSLRQLIGLEIDRRGVKSLRFKALEQPYRDKEPESYWQQDPRDETCELIVEDLELALVLTSKIFN